MTEPLTPEEERSLRNAIARGEPLRLFAVSRGIRHVVTRLLATLDAARQPDPEAALRETLDAIDALGDDPDYDRVTAVAAAGILRPALAAVAAWLAEDDRLARALHVTGLNSIGKAPGHHGKFTERCICNGDAAAIIRALTDTTSADEEAIR